MILDAEVKRELFVAEMDGEGVPRAISEKAWMAYSGDALSEVYRRGLARARALMMAAEIASH